jgi:hypothetical protein
MARLSKEARPDSVGLKAEPAFAYRAFCFWFGSDKLQLASFRVGLAPDQAGATDAKTPQLTSPLPSNMRGHTNKAAGLRLCRSCFVLAKFGHYSLSPGSSARIVASMIERSVLTCSSLGETLPARVLAWRPTHELPTRRQHGGGECDFDDVARDKLNHSSVNRQHW